MKFKGTIFLILFILLTQISNAKDTKPISFIFNLKTYDDKQIDVTVAKQWKFSGYKNKIVILDFFATWCPPCKKSIPHLNTLKKDFKGKLEIIGLDIGNRDGSINSKAKLKQFVKKYKISYPITRGNANNEIFNGLIGLNRSGAIPFMVVFDKNGKYFTHYTGMVPKQRIYNDISSLVKK